MRIGKVINAVCIVGQAATILLLCLALAGIAALCAGLELGSAAVELIDDTTLVLAVNALASDSGLTARELGIMNLAAFAISHAMNKTRKTQFVVVCVGW